MPRARRPRRCAQHSGRLRGAEQATLVSVPSKRAFAPLALLLGVVLVLVVLTLTGVLHGEDRVPLSTSTTSVTVELFGPGAP